MEPNFRRGDDVIVAISGVRCTVLASVFDEIKECWFYILGRWTIEGWSIMAALERENFLTLSRHLDKDLPEVNHD